MVLSLDNKIPQFPSSPSPTAVRDQLGIIMNVGCYILKDRALCSDQETL